jgi:hypothetical protein
MFDYCVSPYRDECDPYLKLIIIDIMLKMSDLKNNHSKGNILIASCICDILQETNLCTANTLQIKLFVHGNFRTRSRYIIIRVNEKHGGKIIMGYTRTSFFASAVLFTFETFC